MAAGLLLVVVALVAAVLATAPGHRALRNWAVSALAKQIDGTVSIGSVGGTLWRAATVRDITLATRDGRPVISADRVRVSFALTDLVRGRFRFSHITLAHPVVVLEQDTAGRWNVQRLFRLPRHAATPGGPRPLVDLRDVTILDGTLIVRERHRSGAPLERTVTGLTATLSRLRASHPDSSGIYADIRTLHLRAVNPSLAVDRADGTALLDGDSVRFALEHLRLPGTSLAVRGTVRWGGAHLAMDLTARAERVAFADVHGVLGSVPATGGGKLDLHVRMPGDGAAEVAVHDADVHTGRSRITGDARVTVGPRGGASLRGTNLVLEPLDLADLSPWVAGMPVRGLVRGRVRGEGALRDLLVDADVAWTDEAAPLAPVNEVSAAGHIGFGGPDQVAFHGLTLRRGEFAFATLARFVPGAELEGRLRAQGRLDGPWRRSAFSGRLAQVGAGDLVSAGRGSVQLDLRDSVRVDADLDMDTVSLDLLRRTWPQIPATGALSGAVHVHGPVAALGVSLDLRGEGGERC